MTTAEFMTVRQVCDRLQVTRSTVHVLIKRGSLRAIKDGALVRVYGDSLTAYLTKHEVAS